MYRQKCSISSREKYTLERFEVVRRFHPGSKILSVGSFGCNLRCPFCQNHEISMSGEGEPEMAEFSPETLADKALQAVAFTQKNFWIK